MVSSPDLAPTRAGRSRRHEQHPCRARCRWNRASDAPGRRRGPASRVASGGRRSLPGLGGTPSVVTTGRWSASAAARSAIRRRRARSASTC